MQQEQMERKEAAAKAAQTRDPKASKILARSLFREMQEHGLSNEQVLAVASQLIAQVTEGLRLEHGRKAGQA